MSPNCGPAATGASSPRSSRNPSDVAQLLMASLKKEKREHFIVVLLTSRHTVLGIETISVGSLNASIVHPREVFRPAIVASAASMILAHNHPSGDISPSDDDIRDHEPARQTRGRLVGIEVLDHIIVGGNGSFLSFQEKGLLH